MRRVSKELPCGQGIATARGQQGRAEAHRLGHDVREELKDDLAGRSIADRHVEEDLGSDGSESGFGRHC